MPSTTLATCCREPSRRRHFEFSPIRFSRRQGLANDHCQSRGSESAKVVLVAWELLPGDGLERVAKGRTGRDTELGKGSVEVTADGPG
jgi:hypothetical protein